MTILKTNSTYFAALLPIAILIYALWLDAAKPKFYRISSTVSSYLSNTYPNSQSETRTGCSLTFLTTDTRTQVFNYYRAVPHLSASDWYTEGNQLLLPKGLDPIFKITADSQIDHTTHVTVERCLNSHQ